MAQVKIEFIGDPSSAQSALHSLTSGASQAATTMSGVFAGMQLSQEFDKLRDSAAEMFNQWHTGVQSMAAQTGAEGAALGDMTNSMAKVGAEVPASLGEIGKTMGDIASRTHLTGEPLEHLTAQFMDLQHLGMPVTVEAATRAFGQWGIATQDQSNKLDQMFRLSQQTGTSMDTIFSSLQSAGPIFQQFGFNFDESAAMLAKWNAEGVNTDKVIAAMRKALAHFGGDVEANDKIVEESKTKIPQLQEAYSRAADGVSSATDNLAKSQKNLQDTYAQTKDRIQSAVDALKSATQALEDAQKPVSALDMAHANLSVEQAATAQTAATNTLAKAEADLDAKRKDSKATAQDVADAELAVEQAHEGVESADLSAQDAEQRRQQLQEKGTDQDRNVVAARQSVTQAEKGVADAKKAGADAIANANDQVNKAEDALGKARQSAADAADKLKEANDKLNAALHPPPGDLKTQLEDVFNRIRDAKDPTDALTIAMDVFGKKAGADMVPLIRSGKMSVDDLMKSVAGGKGTIVGTEQKTKDLADTMQELKNRVGAALGPFGEIGVVFQQFGGLIMPAILLFKMFGGASAEAGAEGAAGGVAFDLAWLPIIALVLAIAAGAYLIIDNWSEISKFFEGVGGAIYDALAFVWNWISDNWPLLLAILFGPFGLAVKFVIDHWNGILDFFSGLINTIADIFVDVGKGIANGFIWGINAVIGAWDWLMDQLKIPGFDVGPVHFGGLDLGGSLKVDKLPYLAAGGVAWAPTLAMIAEAGKPEHIEPLDQYEARMRDHRDASGGGEGGTEVIQLVVDGRVLSEVVRKQGAKTSRRNAGTGVRGR